MLCPRIARFGARTLLVLAGALPLAGSSQCQAPPPVQDGEVATIRGRLTDEGAECPAMRDRANTLYTLSGSLGSFKAGDEVCVRGRRAEMSTCQQGITLIVESIGPASDCP